VSDLIGPTVNSRARTAAAAAGAVGVALLVAALLTTNGVMALVEAVVGLLLLSALIIAYAIRRASRTILYDRLSHRRKEVSHPSPRE
jgi:hypothetical protein